MAEVTVNRTINAPLPDVWASWDDFGGIAQFNPNLVSAHLLQSGQSTGKGATRQCNLADGKNYIRERIVDYAPQSRMQVDIYDGTMPLKKAVVTLSFQPAGTNKTRITMTIQFVPKFGIFGRLMVPMMKPQFRKMLNGLLKGNADFVERGVVLNAA